MIAGRRTLEEILHDPHGRPRTDDEERLLDAHIAIETAAIRETWTEADRRARAVGVTALPPFRALLIHDSLPLQ